MRTGGDFIKIGEGAAVRNNNPCNLRYIKTQKAAQPGYSNFAYFRTKQDGMRACIEEIRTDGEEGHTIRGMIYENTPPEENDTEGYLRQLRACTGIPDTTLVSDVHLGKLAVCVAKLESQTIIIP